MLSILFGAVCVRSRGFQYIVPETRTATAFASIGGNPPGNHASKLCSNILIPERGGFFGNRMGN
jgi:hypothetical protein